MVYYVIKIDSKEYRVRLDEENTPEVSTEIGWLSAQSFIEYLIKNEKQNSLLDLAQIGLDRLLGIKKCVKACGACRRPSVVPEP